MVHKRRRQQPSIPIPDSFPVHPIGIKDFVLAIRYPSINIDDHYVFTQTLLPVVVPTIVKCLSAHIRIVLRIGWKLDGRVQSSNLVAEVGPFRLSGFVGAG